MTLVENPTHKPKKIVLLSDGTGNAVANVWRSNVWRIYEYLDLTRDDQVAFYDDGVGTSSSKPVALAGGIFGYGLKRNVLDAYKFLARHYEEGAEIYAFGFSRGAFTSRVLVALIASQGIVRYQGEEHLERTARAAYRAFQRERELPRWNVATQLRRLRSFLGKKLWPTSKPLDLVPVEKIKFIGVFDTVAAYGLPIEEMTRGVSQYLFPFELPNRFLSQKVKKACHAIAIDDQRTTFHPLLWTETNEIDPPSAGAWSVDNERLSQVWFTGMHSNVGGGYPDDALAFIPLKWMMDESIKAGLHFKQIPEADRDAMRVAQSNRDKTGRIYNSRSGLGSYYRYGPRPINDLSNNVAHRDPCDQVVTKSIKIHKSVFDRMSADRTYRPINLPKHYVVVQDDGQVLSAEVMGLETSQSAQRRHAIQEQVWDVVWWGKFFHALTALSTACLVLFPFIVPKAPSAEYQSEIRIVSEIIRTVSTFVPRAFKWWVDAYAARPELFVGLIVAISVYAWAVSLTQRDASDRMREIWDDPAREPKPKHLMSAFRHSRPTYWFIYLWKWKAAPLLSAAFISYALISFASHIFSNIADSAGAFCSPSQSTVRLPAIKDSQERYFHISSPCFGTGVELVLGERYTVRIERKNEQQTESRWFDGAIETGVYGYELSELGWLSKLRPVALVPYRRGLLRPWFRVLARVGETGTDEDFADPVGPRPETDVLPKAVGFKMEPRQTGELFLYLNDGLLPLPWIYDVFYRNNAGTAKVTIIREPSRDTVATPASQPALDSPLLVPEPSATPQQ